MATIKILSNSLIRATFILLGILWTQPVAFCHQKIDVSYRIKSWSNGKDTRNKHKALYMYTATLVRCGWAGALIKRTFVIREFVQELYSQSQFHIHPYARLSTYFGKPKLSPSGHISVYRNMTYKS